MNIDRLKSDLIRHEGMRLKPYKDTIGKLTIGIGRCLDDVGISEDEALMLLEHDLESAIKWVRTLVDFDSLDTVRQEVLVNMAFNVGIARLREFVHMLNAVAEGDFEKASKEMLDSVWAGQVGARALELAERMRTGTI